MDPLHRALAEIGLHAAARFGFALAGGYAVQAHQILSRPSEDVDLFTAWERRDDFTAAVDAVVNAYRTHGFLVEINQQFVTFARLAVTDPGPPSRTTKVELAANWRAQPPVIMDIGPVLHADDVAAGKVSALYSRAEPLDVNVDVDAAITSGQYTHERLCELAEQADAGFDRGVLADMLAMIDRYADRRFTAYGVTSDAVAGLRSRISDWREELLQYPGS